MNMTPGQAAYEKFRALVPISTRLSMLTWEQYPAEGKDGWEEIAQAAIYARENVGHHRAQAARELGIPIPDRKDLEDDMPFGR